MCGCIFKHLLKPHVIHRPCPGTAPLLQTGEYVDRAKLQGAWWGGARHAKGTHSIVCCFGIGGKALERGVLGLSSLDLLGTIGPVCGKMLHDVFRQEIGTREWTRWWGCVKRYKDGDLFPSSFYSPASSLFLYLDTLNRTHYLNIVFLPSF